jgi:hypothetical protein
MQPAADPFIKESYAGTQQCASGGADDACTVCAAHPEPDAQLRPSSCGSRRGLHRFHGAALLDARPQARQPGESINVSSCFLTKQESILEWRIFHQYIEQRWCAQGAKQMQGSKSGSTVADCVSRQPVVAVFLALKAQNARLADHVNAPLYKSLRVRPCTRLQAIC